MRIQKKNGDALVLVCKPRPLGGEQDEWTVSDPGAEPEPPTHFGFAAIRPLGSY